MLTSKLTAAPMLRLAALPKSRVNRKISTSAAAARTLFATCHPGLEEIVAEELDSPNIGAQDICIGKAGVKFSGDAAVMYRANLWLRSAIRVLDLMVEVDLDPSIPAGDSIYEAFRETVDWAEQLKPGQCFAVDARIYGSSFTNSQLLSVRARDAICDAIRDKRGAKPDPPESGRCPDLPLFVTAFQDKLSIYRDSSGRSLHRRGYRQAMHAASLNEAAASGCLMLAGWHRAVEAGSWQGLADPQCGSGTFLIEAALMATRTAPGIYRRWWPFLGWTDSSMGAWKAAVDAAHEERRPDAQVELWGNDRHAGALSLASRDIKAAGVDNLVRLHHGNCRTWELPKKPTLVMCNPPWGRRLMGGEARDWRGDNGEEEEDLAEAWSGLGAFLKRQAGGADAFILSGSTKPTQFLKLRAGKRIPLTIGGVDCRLLQYQIKGLDPQAAAGPGFMPFDR